MDLVSDRLVKTRKAHDCYLCESNFPKGSAMRSQVVIDDGGDICRNWYCLTCEEYIAFMKRNDRWFGQDGFEYGEFSKDEYYEAYLKSKKLK